MKTLATAALVALAGAAWYVAIVWTPATKRAIELASPARILWVGSAIYGKSVVSWANAVRAFETKAACDAAAKDMATKPDAIAKPMQDPRLTWVFECFPSETVPHGGPP